MKSILYLPADKTHLFSKAVGSGAECVLFDLEDGVCDNAKEAARDQLANLPHGLRGQSACEIGVRISPLSTIDGMKDMQCLMELPQLPEWIFLPKCESPRDLVVLHKLVHEHPTRELVKLCPYLETPSGIANAEAIASAPAPLYALAFGEVDYSFYTGATMSWESLIWPRGMLINAAVENHLWAIDGVFLDFNDPEHLEDESKSARDMGFNAKFAIHPSQVEVINACFEPRDEEVQWALGIIQKHKETAETGLFIVDGAVIGTSAVMRARRILGLPSDPQIASRHTKDVPK
ncbi:(3S)-malyl-CoA thioesterase [Pseudovibrio axinellae]|uniref:(3S)-malyl-CoA thioesterase n=1 Tax=Pseudovibrio axinellae TaxID=989403 RepID=A0A165XIH6_9HYPH|nr:CoA ester lyase [Pseudovibrio axinellae]KZL17734.1 (3S)-malyl-CoA thioesterase [Pseudovibrio axinellae]SER41895.1 (S)-citramalyl-CoA lyase [Pseudovibrio axinellae]